jgi:hypothetical protein
MRQIATDKLPPSWDAYSFAIYFYVSGTWDDKLELFNKDIVWEKRNDGLAPEPR